MSLFHNVDVTGSNAVETLDGEDVESGGKILGVDGRDVAHVLVNSLTKGVDDADFLDIVVGFDMDVVGNRVRIDSHRDVVVDVANTFHDAVREEVRDV